MSRQTEINILSLALSEECGKVFTQIDESEFADPNIRSVFGQAKRFWKDTGSNDFGALIFNGSQEEKEVAVEALNSFYRSMDAEAHIASFKNEAAISKAKFLGAKLSTITDFSEISEISAELQKVNQGSSKVVSVTYADLIDRFATRKTQKLEAYETGFPRLDSHVVISPGDFVILLAEQSAGKTAFSIELMNRTDT